jgi:hypothetical protein
MSYMDEYNKLKKKREEKEKKASAKKQTSTKADNSNANSFMNEYNKLKEKRVNSSKPVESVSSQSTQSKREEAEKDERKWFEKGAFEDGWQWGDLTKTIFGSKDDAEENLWAGVLGIGEKLVDAGATLGTAMNQSSMMQAAQSEMMYNAISGNKTDASTVLSRYQKVQDEVEKGTAEFVANDLYDEEKVAHTIISGKNYIPRSVIGYDVETDSVFGEKSDALVQSGRQLLAQMGVNTLLIQSIHEY